MAWPSCSVWVGQRLWQANRWFYVSLPHSDSLFSFFPSVLSLDVTPLFSSDEFGVFACRNSARKMATKVQASRRIIHELTASTSMSYGELYGNGRANAASGSEHDAREDDGGEVSTLRYTSPGHFDACIRWSKSSQRSGQQNNRIASRSGPQDGDSAVLPVAAVGSLFENPFPTPATRTAGKVGVKQIPCEVDQSFKTVLATSQVRVVAVSFCLSSCRLVGANIMLYFYFACKGLLHVCIQRLYFRSVALVLGV